MAVGLVHQNTSRCCCRTRRRLPRRRREGSRGHSISSGYWRIRATISHRRGSSSRRPSEGRDPAKLPSHRRKRRGRKSAAGCVEWRRENGDHVRRSFSFASSGAIGLTSARWSGLSGRTRKALGPVSTYQNRPSAMSSSDQRLARCVVWTVCRSIGMGTVMHTGLGVSLVLELRADLSSIQKASWSSGYIVRRRWLLISWG